MKTFVICGIAVVLCVVQTVTALAVREPEEADKLEERSSSCLMLMRDSNNCNGHGYCRAGRNGYSCSCYVGWGGRDCVDALAVREPEEADKLEERSSSCLMLMRDSNNCNGHGYCRAGRNGYSCSCYVGWGGRDCVDALAVREPEEADELEERSSSCLMLMRDSNNCNGHGYCRAGRNGYSCGCNEGWGGRDCVDAVGPANNAIREVDTGDKEPMSKRAKVLELLRKLLE